MFPVVKHWQMWTATLLGMLLILTGLLMAATAAQASAPVVPMFMTPVDVQQSPPDAEPGGNATARVNANLRQGPGTTYPVVGGATAGQALEIVAKNAAGDWYQLADGRWIFASLVNGAPAVEADDKQAQPVTTEPAPAQPGPAPAPAADAGGGEAWVLVADSAANFPGGRDRNHWYYLWTEGRGNFVWQDMRQSDINGCYQDTANKGLEICADSMTANPKGDVGLQWKASRGGDYRFEWDAASLKFYKHGEFVGILDPGTELPYATTVTDVIEWEMFFWVAADSTKFHVKVFRREETAAPAGAPESAPAAVPAATAIPTPAASLTFGSGMQIVGRDIAAGTYRAPGGRFCYWERLRGFGGTLGDIIANNIGAGPQIVTIAATDKGFDSSGCGNWTLDLSPVTSSPNNPFGDGIYFVGKDIASGTWQASGGNGCYWERLTGFSGQLRDIKANDVVNGSTVVDIEPGDQGFSSHRCGTWTKLY